MSRISDISVPTLFNKFPKEPRPYPISERENLMLAFNHEKPKWMPNLEGSTQDLAPGGGGGNHGKTENYRNEWGVEFRYSEVQGSATNVSTVLDDITKWKSLPFPKVDKEGIAEGAKSFERDESLALCGHTICSCFELLHMLEGFEQALVDLITEPKACLEFFEAVADYSIESFLELNKHYRLDYLMYHDDWGTARGPFFSVDLMKETMLAPTKRYAKAVQAEGVKFIFHNCGLVNDFVPYMVEDVGADGLQIQHINDLKHIISTYGAKTTVEFRRPETFKMFDPETTLDEVRGFARMAVDMYGAHANPGAGCVVTINAPTAEAYNAFDEEMVLYSMEKYKNL